MTDRNEVANHEKLIEEAELALVEAVKGSARIEDWAAAVWSVFEKALGEATVTPTDDERQALAQAIRDSLGVTPETVAAGHQRPGNTDDLASDLIARGFGFRRTEVPEPSADEKTEWPDHWTTNEKLRDLHARWHDQKGNLLGREACGWEGCEFWDSAQFTLRLADVKIAGREPQGEPSDIAVDDAIAAFDGYPGDIIERSSRSWRRDRMRAALRAAMSLREGGVR